MTRRRTRRGIALMLVAASTATTLGAWSLAARQVAALVRIKAALQAREEATAADPDRCRVRALAYGLALLETGHPPVPEDGPGGLYRCNVTVGQPRGGAVTYTLTFEPVEGDEDSWIVGAGPATDLGLPGPGGFVAADNP